MIVADLHHGGGGTFACYSQYVLHCNVHGHQSECIVRLFLDEVLRSTPFEATTRRAADTVETPDIPRM